MVVNPVQLRPNYVPGILFSSVELSTAMCEQGAAQFWIVAFWWMFFEF